MNNREKVIKGLEVCLKNIDQQDCPNDCPYLSDCSKYENRVIFQPLMRDALTMLMLKEQEPKKVEWRIGRAHCPSCGELFSRKKETQHIRFCSFCGQAVKWE